MMKKKKVLNKEMREKITVSHFLSVHVKVLITLFKIYTTQTILMLILSVISLLSGFINLKYIEILTNDVQCYLYNDIVFSSLIEDITFFFILFVFFTVITSVKKRLQVKYISEVSSYVEKEMTEKIASISYEYFEDHQLYEKLNLASQTNQQYGNAIFGLIQILEITVMLITYCYLLSDLNPLFLLTIFASIFVSITISAKTTDRQLDYWRMYVSPDERRENYFKNIFSNRINQQNIQVSRTYDYFADKYTYFLKREKINFLKLNIFSFFTESATSLLFLITFFITVLIVSINVVKGELEIGYYTMVITLLTSLFATLKQFANFMMKRNWYIKVLDAYYNIMELDDYSITKCSSTNVDSSLILDNVCYKYPQSTDSTLKHISLNIKHGEKISIVGYNGSGKTTLISTILNLLHVDMGNIQCNFNYAIAVFQDFGQYQMSVKENIEIGNGGKPLPNEAIIDILKKVGMYDYVAQLPDGIDTKLGQLDDGVELSKGQWQRLAIGRLLANDVADIWILDEPTSFLDPIAEIEMYHLIFKLAEKRTVFFISHRLGFAKNADRILVMDNGTIVEDGCHDYLMRTGGLYSRMYQVQKEWYS